MTADVDALLRPSPAVSFRDLAAMRSDAEAVAGDAVRSFEEILYWLGQHGSLPNVVSMTPHTHNRIRWARYGATPKARARLSTQAPRRSLWKRKQEQRQKAS